MPDTALPYLERIRSYYQALGYGAPYEWAHFKNVPFARLEKPLASARIGLVTTAALYQPGKGEQGPGAPYNGAAKFYAVYSAPTDPYPDLRISHIAYDRDHTTAEDQGTFFPLKALQTLADQGVIGKISARFYGLPTNRSQRTTIDVDCPRLLAECRQDGVNAVVLVPNCPVCHQSVSLAARSLESAGIATVIMGAARDIVEHVGVPRLLFSNVPLGNAAGLPNDPASQKQVAEMAMGLLETATSPRTTRQSPLRWPGDPNWQDTYANAAKLSASEIARRRADFDKGKADAARIRQGASRKSGDSAP